MKLSLHLTRRIESKNVSIWTCLQRLKGGDEHLGIYCLHEILRVSAALYKGASSKLHETYFKRSTCTYGHFIIV